MKNFIDTYDVSRETFEKLKTYERLLVEWQQKFNLVSNSTLECAWERHFLDSAQLFKFIPPNAKIMYDFGSGAGFSGMVLAIMANEKTPYLKVKLVESTGKKTLYLNEVKNQTSANVEIINQRIESLVPEKADVITSRALSSLKELFEYAHKFCSLKTTCIFPKGKKYQEEIADARKSWNFDCQVFDSEQSDEGKILVITKLSKIKGVK